MGLGYTDYVEEVRVLKLMKSSFSCSKGHEFSAPGNYTGVCPYCVKGIECNGVVSIKTKKVKIK